MMPRRHATILLTVLLAVALGCVAPSLAAAAPVTLDFESGATLGQQVTNQYGAPGTPAGPTFMEGTKAGFAGIGCRPPTLDNSVTAHSGTQALKLDGCTGGEFWSTATFFALGYSTAGVDFWVTVPGKLTVGVPVVTTAFNAAGQIVEQTETVLPPQATTTYTHVAMSTVGDEIAFVAIEEGTEGTNSASATGVGETAGNNFLYVDDLTYDPPSSPPAASFRLGAAPSVATVVPGSSGEVTIPVTWTNNPNPTGSPVELEASPPSGVTVSFTPDPTTTGSSTLRLTAAKSAPIGRTAMAVRGVVDRGLPSEKEATLSLPVEVVAPYEIVQPPTVTVAPCTEARVKLKIQTPLAFTEPVAVGVSVPNTSDVILTSISGGTVADASDATTTLVPKDGIAEATLGLTARPGASKAALHLTITAMAPGFASLSQSSLVVVEPGEIDAVDAGTSQSPVTGGLTPRLHLPGSQLTLRGLGFCPGSKVAIGDPNQTVEPEAVGGDGRSLTFRVPRGAATGPVIVTPPTGAHLQGPRLTIASFRNTFGFAWANGDYGLRLNEQMIDELFGKEETNIDVFGWLVRKPEAYLFETMTNNYIPGGICFGMAYSSLSFQQGIDTPEEFPHSGGNTVWNLDGFHQPSPSLLQFVTERFSLQFTDQLIPAELNTVLGVHGTNDDVNAIEGELNQGHPVMIGLIHWNGIKIEGHSVLAYDAHALPDGSTAVDLLNSNVPYLTKEEEEPSLHDESEFSQSQLIVKNGNWTFPELGWSGSEADLVVYHHDELPLINGHQPKLPNVFTAATMVAFGSAGDSVTQVQGGGGDLVRKGKLAPRGSWPAGVAPVPNYDASPHGLQLLALDGPSAPLTATVRRGKGGGAMNLRLPGLQASLDAATTPGQVDAVSVDPRSDAIGYSPGGGSTPLGGTLLAAPGSGATAKGAAVAARAGGGSEEHLVSFKTTAGGGEEKLAFRGGRSFALDQGGRPAPLQVSLGNFGPGVLPSAVRLPTIHVAPGEKVSVSPADWKRLGAGTVTVRTVIAGRRTTRHLSPRVLGGRFATVSRATLVGGRHPALELKLHVPHPPAHGWIAITGKILTKGRSLKLPSVQVGAAALRRGIVLMPLGHLPNGVVAVRLRMLETSAVGALQSSVPVNQTQAIGKRGRR